MFFIIPLIDYLVWLSFGRLIAVSLAAMILKKEKAPNMVSPMAMIDYEKAPNKKRETAACGSACLRAAAPPSSLLLLSRFFRAAAPPYPFRFSSASSAAAPPHSPPRSRGRLAPPPLSTLSFLSIKQLTILPVTVTCHELFFFCNNNNFLDTIALTF